MLSDFCLFYIADYTNYMEIFYYKKIFYYEITKEIFIMNNKEDYRSH